MVEGIWVDNTGKEISGKSGAPLSELETDGDQEAPVWLDGAIMLKA